VVQPNSFAAIVPQQRFERAQTRLGQRVFLRSDEQLLDELREFVKTHRRVTQAMLDSDPNMASATTYHSRFGSFRRALELIREEPAKGFSVIERRARLKIWLQDEFIRTLAANNVQSHRKHGSFVSSSHPPVLLDVARCFVLDSGERRWEVRYPLTGVNGLQCIMLRLDPDGKLPLDYVFIRCLPQAIQRYRFSEDRIRDAGVVTGSLQEAIRLLLGKAA
jgi:hypothetical protein